MTFKNIRIKMKSGKSRTQRVKVLASGKYKFVKNVSKTTSRTRKVSPTRRKGVKRMPRRKKKRSSNRSKKIPLITTLTTTNYLWNGLGGAKIAALQAGNISGYLDWALKDMIMYGTGYDKELKTWSFNNFMVGTGTIIIGEVARKILGYFGVNRKISKIPIIGKFLSL